MEGGLGDFAKKGIQYGSAALGPGATALAGAGLAANSLNQISNMRASSIIARAQGLTDQADAIDKMVADFMADQPKAVSLLDDIVATGAQKAQSVMDRLGLMGKKDKTGKYTFTAEEVARNKRAAEADKEAKKEEVVMSQDVVSDGDNDRRGDGLGFGETAKAGESDMEKAIADEVADYAASGKTFDANDPSTWAAKGGLMTKKNKKKKR